MKNLLIDNIIYFIIASISLLTALGCYIKFHGDFIIALFIMTNFSTLVILFNIMFYLYGENKK